MLFICLCVISKLQLSHKVLPVMLHKFDLVKFKVYKTNGPVLIVICFKYLWRSCGSGLCRNANILYFLQMNLTLITNSNFLISYLCNLMFRSMKYQMLHHQMAKTYGLRKLEFVANKRFVLFICNIYFKS